MTNRKNDPLHVEWAKRVKARDKNRCAICGKRSKWNHAHHIDGYSWFPAGRYLIRNGATLCRNHHDLFHKTYGNRNNNRYQFEEFKRVNKR